MQASWRARWWVDPEYDVNKCGKCNKMGFNRHIDNDSQNAIQNTVTQNEQKGSNNSWICSFWWSWYDNEEQGNGCIFEQKYWFSQLFYEKMWKGLN